MRKRICIMSIDANFFESIPHTQDYGLQFQSVTSSVKFSRLVGSGRKLRAESHYRTSVSTTEYARSRECTPEIGWPVVGYPFVGCN